MTVKSTKSASEPKSHGYEFGGPIGTFLIISVLPIVLFAQALLCNDISGCPVPSTLSPSTLTLEKLKQEVGWPANGVWGLVSLEASLATLGWYGFSLVLYRLLPAQELQGQALPKTGKTLKYRFNGLASSFFTLSILAAGTALQGADFVVWRFMNENYLQIMTANIIIAYVLAIYVYIGSFSVKPGNKELRELAPGGHTGNLIYDFWIGRELNPRVTLPLIGEIDIKTWCETRPGLLGWMVYDLAFAAQQYKNYGYLTDSMILTTLFQSLYVIDCFWIESSILTQIDITTDGFGFMLSFGDLAWVPFIYSIQARYLSVFPLSLGISGVTGVFIPLAIGYSIFRLANNQKFKFRTQPNDPSVKHLEYITTKTGSRLITSGWWWGKAAHLNYGGDWIQGWAYVLPTGMSGYQIYKSSVAPTAGQSLADGSYTYQSNGVYTQVIQGGARGWGMVFTYFYLLYFAILLVHRERRDDHKCANKYGEDWKKYKSIVKYRILPGIY